MAIPLYQETIAGPGVEPAHRTGAQIPYTLANESHAGIAAAGKWMATQGEKWMGEWTEAKANNEISEFEGNVKKHQGDFDTWVASNPNASMEDMKTAQQTMMTRIAGEGQNMSTKKSNQFAQNWHLSQGPGVKASSDVSMAKIGYMNEYNKTIAGIAAATEDNDYESVRRQAERASGTSDFNVRYQPTKLDATQEAAFQQSYAAYSGASGGKVSADPDNPLHFYDYRGAWQEQGGGAITPDAEGHLPSKWKLAGHPNTFVGGIHTPSGKRYKGGVLSVEHANYLVAKARTKAAKARVEQQVQASHKAAYEIMDGGGSVKQAYEETKDGIPYSDQKEYLAELKAREEAMEAIKAEELERVENAMNATLYKEMSENKGLILKEDVNKFYEEGHPMRKVWSDLADQGSVEEGEERLEESTIEAKLARTRILDKVKRRVDEEGNEYDREDALTELSLTTGITFRDSRDTIDSIFKLSDKEPDNTMRRSLYTHTIDTLRNSIEQRTGSRGGRFEQDAEILTELADKAELEFRTMFQNDQWEPEDLAKGADTIGKKWAASPSVVRNIQQRKKAKVKEQAEKNTADALADIKSLRDAGKEDEAIAKAEEYMDRGVIAQWQLEGKPDPRLATELQKPKFNWKKLFLGD